MQICVFVQNIPSRHVLLLSMQVEGRVWVRVLACLLLLGWGAETAADNTVPRAEIVSLVQLIATPERYDGRAVAVVGFLRLEFEGHCLYLHEEDYRHGIRKNAVWVMLNHTINDRSAELNMHYVILVGTFDAKHKGPMDPYSGSLVNVTAAKVWR